MAFLEFPEILEENASGKLKAVYAEIRRVMRVPIVPFFWRALATHPDFFVPVWEQFKPNAGSQYIETKAAEIRKLALLTDSNQLPDLEANLRKSGWNSSRIREIKQKVNSYRYITPKMLLFASAIGESLVRGSIGGTNLLPQRTRSVATIGSKKLPMASLKSPSKDTENILGQIKADHEWHGIASAYRTFALYPEFLTVAWNDVVRPVVRSDEYNAKANELYRLASNYALRIPYTLNIGAEWRAEVGIRGAGEIKVKVRIFRRFLSDFLIDVQRIKVSLDGIDAAKSREGG